MDLSWHVSEMHLAFYHTYVNLKKCWHSWGDFLSSFPAPLPSDCPHELTQNHEKLSIYPLGNPLFILPLKIQPSLNPQPKLKLERSRDYSLLLKSFRRGIWFPWPAMNSQLGWLTVAFGVWSTVLIYVSESVTACFKHAIYLCLIKMKSLSPHETLH